VDKIDTALNFPGVLPAWRRQPPDMSGMATFRMLPSMPMVLAQEIG
jgi:hypothetical protein